MDRVDGKKKKKTIAAALVLDLDLDLLPHASPFTPHPSKPINELQGTPGATGRDRARKGRGGGEFCFVARGEGKESEREKTERRVIFFNSHAFFFLSPLTPAASHSIDDKTNYRRSGASKKKPSSRPLGREKR